MYMTYLEKLKALREDNDYSLKQIADILGIAQSTYSQYERGTRALPIESLIMLCNFYHVSPNYLLDWGK